MNAAPSKHLVNLVVLLSLLLTACSGLGQPAADGGVSKELNLYAWSEYIPQSLIEAFTAETGIKVNYDIYANNEELLAKMQAGAAGYDVIQPSDYAVTVMINQGLLEPLDFSKIPNFENIGPEFRNNYYDPENKYSVPYQWGTVGLAINRQKITRPVTRWADLWDPEFAGRVILVDDPRETLGMVLIMLGHDRNTTDPALLEKAKQKLLELLPGVRLMESDSPKTALLAEEVWIGQTWNGEAALAHAENPNIDYICPEEGCGIYFDTLAIPANAPHKDAAHAFLNFVLRPEASILITKEFPYSNPNLAALELLKQTDPDVYQAYMSFTATNPSVEEISKAHPIIDIGEATALWDRIWTEVKGSQP